MSRRQCGRAPIRGGDHDLIGVLLPEIADGEDPRDTRFAFFIRNDVTARIDFNADRNELVVGRKPHKNEYPVRNQVSFISCPGVFKGNPTDPTFAGLDFRNHGIEDDFNFGLGHDALLEDSTCPESIPSMNQVDLPGNFGKIKGIFESRIAASHGYDGFIPEKEPVAGSTVGNAFAEVIDFAGNVESSGAAACGQNHGVGLEKCAAGQPDRMNFYSRLNGYGLILDYLKAIPFGMLQKFIAKFEPAYLDESRVIFYIFGNGHLPTGHSLFDQDRLQGGPHGIHAGGKPSRTAADDKAIINFIFHHNQAPFSIASLSEIPIPKPDPGEFRVNEFIYI
jgi:hypothetical protein